MKARGSCQQKKKLSPAARRQRRMEIMSTTELQEEQNFREGFILNLSNSAKPSAER